MREKFLSLVGGWISQYKSDIRSKVDKFINETESDPDELAYMIDAPVEEIIDILEGRGERISVETFGKILLASGYAVRIEPIEKSPLGSYDNINPEVMQQPRRTPQPNPFARPIGGMRPTPPSDFDPSNIPSFIRERMERDGVNPIPRHNPFEQPRVENERHQSPFRTMPREKLVGIIRDKLWDSEIDVENAPLSQLVLFLEEKDRRMQEVKRRAKEREEEAHIDPTVVEFTNRLKRSVKENPRLRSYVKKFLNGLDEE